MEKINIAYISAYQDSTNLLDKEVEDFFDEKRGRLIHVKKKYPNIEMFAFYHNYLAIGYNGISVRVKAESDRKLEYVLKEIFANCGVPALIQKPQSKREKLFPLPFDNDGSTTDNAYLIVKKLLRSQGIIGLYKVEDNYYISTQRTPLSDKLEERLD